MQFLLLCVFVAIMALEIIIMGDVVGSSGKDSSALIKRFEQAISHTNKLHKKNIKSPLTITLGDEFQGVVNSVHTGLEIIFTLEEYFVHTQYDLPIRYVIHQGEIETPIKRKKAHGMLGVGLTKARRKLEELKSRDSRYFISLQNTNLTSNFNNATNLYQYFKDKWKQKDLLEVSYFLKGENNTAIAEKLKKHPTSVWRRKKSLSIKEYMASKALLLFLAE